MWTSAVAPPCSPPPTPHLLLLPLGLLRPSNCHSDNIPPSLHPHLHLLHPSFACTFLLFSPPPCVSICLFCFHPSFFHVFHFWMRVVSSWIPADQTLAPFTLIAFFTVTSHSCCTEIYIDIYLYTPSRMPRGFEEEEKKKESFSSALNLNKERLYGKPWR